MSSLSKKKQNETFIEEQEGSATVEFVLLFPAFVALFLMGFESGYYMVRNVMLERAVDVAVRDVRLGNGNVPEYVALKEQICEEAMMFTDCVNSLQIEMQSIEIEPGGTDAVAGNFACVDKRSNDDPLDNTTYDVGQENQMMMVRVCALSQPLFPTTGIGVGMKYDLDGNYALVATTAFVNEPGNRAIAPSVSSGSAGDPAGQPMGNNGFGNGDQDAPGESLETNGAENDQTTGGNGSSGNNAGGNGNGNAGGNS
ncbi:pilus assembly protein [bacterium]|nr:pilus assembly protein [bacterium]